MISEGKLRWSLPLSSTNNDGLKQVVFLRGKWMAIRALLITDGIAVVDLEGAQVPLFRLTIHYWHIWMIKTLILRYLTSLVPLFPEILDPPLEWNTNCEEQREKEAPDIPDPTVISVSRGPFSSSSRPVGCPECFRICQSCKGHRS